MEKRVNTVDYGLEFSSLTPRYQTNFIVIHHSGTAEDMDLSAEDIHQMHQNQGWAGCGYHFVIRKDGTIELGRPVDCVGALSQRFLCDFLLSFLINFYQF